MRLQFVQPSGILKEFIRYYCLMETDPCEQNIKERVIPVENIQLMFHYKKPFALFGADNILSVQPRSIVSGLSSSFSDVATLGESGVIFVSFHTAGACHFFKFPLTEFENQSFDLTEVLGKEVRQVEEQLSVTPAAMDKIGIVEGFLLKRFNPIAPHNYELVKKGIKIIAARGGKIPAAFLANHLAVTPKTLERKFAAYIGKTPRQFGKLIRFRKVLKDFSALKNINLTDYAYRNGYFDQSHFIHDFKMYSGYTPKEFISKYPDFSPDDYSCEQ